MQRSILEESLVSLVSLEQNRFEGLVIYGIDA